MLPLIVAKIMAVGSLFNAGFYRSFSNYVSDATDDDDGDDDAATGRSTSEPRQSVCEGEVFQVWQART